MCIWAFPGNWRIFAGMCPQKKILIAPLDWGLGHAARCIPLIRNYIRENHRVFLASNGRSKALLQQHFPDIPFLPDPPDYAIRYSTFFSFGWKMLFQLPRMLRVIREEHQWLLSQCEEHEFDMIISDNRYGLGHPNIRSVILTHQTAPIVPSIFGGMIHGKIRSWNERFSETWIPDTAPIEHSFGGKLSHENLPRNHRYIGGLSRFSDMQPVVPDEQYSVVAVISGPEPLRSDFEQSLIRRFAGSGERVLLVAGTMGDAPMSRHSGTTDRMEKCDDAALASFLAGAKKIVSRSGYSSIMDYAALGVMNKVEWHPTPGQTEQEYLARRMKEMNNRGC